MDERREKLLELDKEVLADALLKVAMHSEEAEETITRMVSTPSENQGRVKRKIATLRDRGAFYDWRAAASFARELEGMVEAIEASAEDPKEGVELLADFFESDQSAIESCDDSNGEVGDIFRNYATEVFAAFGQQCKDKAWLSDVVLRLWVEDNYGVRERILENARAMFPAKIMRDMATRLWAQANEISAAEEHSEYKRRKFLTGVQTLARQLGDAPLYERAMRAAWTDLPAAFCLDIATVYLETGDAVTALKWAEEVAEDDHRASERDDLLYAIYEKQKNREALEEVAWRIFHRNRNERTLDKLLKAIGKKKRTVVLEQECKAILAAGKLSYSDASFLVEVDRLDDAARYVMMHADALNGDHYYYLFPLAEAMEQGKHWLPAVLCYRALTNSILLRGVSKYYHHGVKYLRQLDKIAGKVDDWRNIASHGEFLKTVSTEHKRKRSFWERYGRLPES